MTSLRLHRPACPQCDGANTHFDVTAPSNLWRTPLAMASAAILYPIVGTCWRCSVCRHRFVTTRDATAAAAR